MIIVILAVLCASLALADDFKTINGKESLQISQSVTSEERPS
jgi:hypothetical protein